MSFNLPFELRSHHWSSMEIDKKESGEIVYELTLYSVRAFVLKQLLPIKHVMDFSLFNA